MSNRRIIRPSVPSTHPRLLVSNEEILKELNNSQSQGIETNASEGQSGGDAEMGSENSDQQTSGDPSLQNNPEDQTLVNLESSSDDLMSLESDVDSDNGKQYSPPKKRAKRGPKIGRSKDSVWEDFTTSYDDKKKVKSNKCKHCRKEVSAKPTRMNAHLKTCKSHKRLVDDVPVRSGDLPVSLSSSSSSARINSESPAVPTKDKEPFPTTAQIKSRMKIWTSNAAKKAVKDMDLTIGKMIFSGNLPFQFSNNPFLEEITDKAQIPNYKPPNPQKIGGPILDDLYDACVATNRNKFRGKKVVILQDGWSTNQNEPVICHTIHTGSESLMFHAVATKLNKKDSPYCFKLLEDAIALAEKTFKCDVVGVVTDNCSVMNNMRAMATEKIKGFHAYGCIAHLINLCGQELTDNVLMIDIVKIQKFFRNHHFESAALVELKGNRPSIPGKTRWNSQLDTLESYTKNHLLYMQIARDRKSNISKNSELLDILNDGNKYNLVVRQLEVLKPVAVTLDKIQSEKRTLADAVDSWIALISNLPEEAGNNQYVIEKSGMILTGVGLAAHMLHPIYRGRNLNRDQEALGFAEMTRLHFQLPVMASCLKALDDNIFPPHLLKEDAMKLMSPSAWWRGAGAYSNSILPKIVEICDGLMILPASTASLERAFSTMGNIITKKRNRLGIEKARKLAVIHKTLAFEMEDDERDED